MAHNQFELLKQRRFLPFFLTAALGAFNDNVFRNAMLGLIIALGLSNDQVALYSNLAPALFILPYFLFSATAGQIAEKYEKAALIRGTTELVVNVLDKNPATTFIVIEEVDTDNWGIGGESVTTLRRRARDQGASR